MSIEPRHRGSHKRKRHLTNSPFIDDIFVYILCVLNCPNTVHLIFFPIPLFSCDWEPLPFSVVGLPFTLAVTLTFFELTLIDAAVEILRALSVRKIVLPIPFVADDRVAGFVVELGGVLWY